MTRPSPGRLALGPGVMLSLALALTACGDLGSTPTATPSDVLVIVTATPGLPQQTPRPVAERRYVVREGDTLSAIALRFDVTEAALQRANSIDDPDSLVVGQELLIPPPEP